MKRVNLIVIAVAVIMWTIHLTSQTTQVAPVIPPDTPFKVAFSHDRSGGERYRIWCDGTIVKNYAESEVTITGVSPNQEITVIVPGLARGARSCLASAYIDGIGEEKGMPNIIPIGMVIAVPSQIRVVIEIIKDELK